MILVDGRLSFDELQWRLVTYRSTGYDGPVRADRPTSLSRYDAALLIGITRSECGVTVSGREPAAVARRTSSASCAPHHLPSDLSSLPPA